MVDFNFKRFMKKILVSFFSVGLICMTHAKNLAVLSSSEDTVGQVVDASLSPILQINISRQVSHELPVELFVVPLKLSTDTSDYDKGRNDAKKYHKRALGNAALGIFVPWGFIGIAVLPTKLPDSNHIENKALLQNKEYLRGYRNKAKAKNIGNAAIGSVTFFVVGMALFIANFNKFY